MQKYGKIKAKRTYYKGILFKSNLEAKVAESFDVLHIPWKYEETCFRGSSYVGGQYTPDFFLPNLGLYVEVAGVWDLRHEINALTFIRENGKKLITIDGDGVIWGLEVWKKETIHYTRALLICEKCVDYFIACDVTESVVCPHCGAEYTEINELDYYDRIEMVECSSNILWSAQQVRDINEFIRKHGTENDGDDT